jgi:cytosolic 5'-nucleotidase 3
MQKNIIISNPEEFNNKKNIFKNQGKEKIHVVSDFDRTITYGLTKTGKRTETVISQLRSDPKYLGEDYQKKAHELFDIYHPIEINNNISLNEKKEKMHEWWEKHFDLIASVGLTKDLIEKVVLERPLKFRDGSLDFIKTLYKNNIPLIFMSAAPGDMLEKYLEKNKLLFPNVFVISNKYEFDVNGKASKIIEPIIHTFNKTEISLEKTPIFKKIKDRKNVILLGDSIGDIGIAEGFSYNNIIKIGFLNENIEDSLDEFKKNFDVIILNDGNMDFVNTFIKEIT